MTNNFLKNLEDKLSELKGVNINDICVLEINNIQTMLMVDDLAISMVIKMIFNKEVEDYLKFDYKFKRAQKVIDATGTYIARYEDEVSFSYLDYIKFPLSKRIKKYVEEGEHQGVDDTGYYVIEYKQKTEKELMDEIIEFIDEKMKSSIKEIKPLINEAYKEQKVENITKDEMVRLNKRWNEEISELENKAREQVEKEHKDISINVDFKDIIENTSNYKLLGEDNGK